MGHKYVYQSQQRRYNLGKTRYKQEHSENNGYEIPRVPFRKRKRSKLMCDYGKDMDVDTIGDKARN